MLTQESLKAVSNSFRKEIKKKTQGNNGQATKGIERSEIELAVAQNQTKTDENSRGANGQNEIGSGQMLIVASHETPHSGNRLSLQRASPAFGRRIQATLGDILP